MITNKNTCHRGGGGGGGQQTTQAVPPAQQTRSGRIVRNMPRYDQSVNQRDQGLVAWEVLLDQDVREDVPTAESQYAIQSRWKTPWPLRHRLT